jgi:hypothetical protein
MYGDDSGKRPKSPSRGGSPVAGTSPQPQKPTASAMMLRDIKGNLNIDTMSASTERPDIVDRTGGNLPSDVAIFMSLSIFNHCFSIF